LTAKQNWISQLKAPTKQIQVYNKAINSKPNLADDTLKYQSHHQYQKQLGCEEIET